MSCAIFHYMMTQRRQITGNMVPYDIILENLHTTHGLPRKDVVKYPRRQ